MKFASDKSYTVGNDTMGGWEDYNYSQVMTNLTAYTSDDAASATSMIDGLTASGATSADYGMQHAHVLEQPIQRIHARRVEQLPEGHCMEQAG